MWHWFSFQRAWQQLCRNDDLSLVQLWKMYDSVSGVSHSHVSWMTYLNLDYMDKNAGPPTYHASAMETHCIVFCPTMWVLMLNLERFFMAFLFFNKKFFFTFLMARAHNSKRRCYCHESNVCSLFLWWNSRATQRFILHWTSSFGPRTKGHLIENYTTLRWYSLI